MLKNLSVVPGVIVERVGNDLMVIVPGDADVVSLSGRPAEVLLDVKAGKAVDASDPVVLDLVDLGIVSGHGVSRRGLIKAGAVGVGAGIAVLAMPGVAAAASVVPLKVFGFYVSINPYPATYFDVRGFDFPNRFLDNRSDGAISPSVLSVNQGPWEGEVHSWDTTGAAGTEDQDYYNGDYVAWRVSGVHPDELEGKTYVGTFTWDGVAYEAEFGPEM